MTSEFLGGEYENHPCKRPCTGHQNPQICQYKFTIENYYTMSKACHDCPTNRTDCLRPDCIAGDGHSRAVISVNRMIPGPSLEVINLISFLLVFLQRFLGLFERFCGCGRGERSDLRKYFDTLAWTAHEGQPLHGWGALRHPVPYFAQNHIQVQVPSEASGNPLLALTFWYSHSF